MQGCADQLELMLSLAGALPSFVEQQRERIAFHRYTEQDSLSAATTHVLQQSALGCGFDAFGNQVELQVVGETDDGAGQGPGAQIAAKDSSDE